MIFGIFWKTFVFSGNFGGFEISDIFTFCVNWCQNSAYSREKCGTQYVHSRHTLLQKTQTRNTTTSYSRENNLCTAPDLHKTIS